MAQLTIQDAFDLALRHHHAGRLHDAEQLYRRILAQQPEHAGAMHHLGLIAHQVGKNEVAAEVIRMAIALNSNLPEAHFNLGNALKEAGRLDEAIDAYRRAIAIKPNYAEAYTNLGIALNEEGRRNEAIDAYRQAIAINSNLPEAHYNLGNALKEAGRLEEAIVAYLNAITFKPNLADAHNNLGNALKDMGRLNEAVAAYRQAVALWSGHAEAYNNLGIALELKGELNEAIAACRQALALRPDYYEAWSNLGYFLIENNQPNEAIAALRQALAVRPTYELALFHLATVLAFEGQFDQVMDEYRRATMRAKPVDHSGLGQPVQQLPYIGNRVILVSCPRQVRQELRTMGLGDWNHDAFDAENAEYDPIASSVTIADHTERVAAIRAYIDEVSRNQAAMSGKLCAIWMEDIPQGMLEAIRQASGDDRLEVTAESVADAVRQIEPHGKRRPDTAGKVFAVCSIRNGAIDLLPHWLEHYTKLGADQLLLGLFDDVSPKLRDEIARYADRWRFTCFSQTWKGSLESLHERQRRSGCRLAGAVGETWILHTDLDEFHEFPAPLNQIIAAAQTEGISAVMGWLLDRVAGDGSLPSIRSSPTLWEQFPISCRLTAKVLRAVTQKIMLARFGVPVRNGHHDLAGNAKLGLVPIGRAKQYIVHHFKWHGDLLARLEWSVSQPNTQPEWKTKANHFLTWLKASGGRINLDDPVFQVKNAASDMSGL